ncbi:MAG: hypothetical protein ACI4T3_05835 [Lactobacillus sp.]
MTEYLTRNELIKLNHDVRPDVPAQGLVQDDSGIDVVAIQKWI